MRTKLLALQQMILHCTFDHKPLDKSCYHTQVHPLIVKGTVSQTAHVQVINQKWSDVFKKWRQQAEDNPHSHGGRRNYSGRKQCFLIPAAAGKRNGRSREEEINIYKSWLQAKLEATYSSTRNSEFAMNLLSLENRRR